MGTNSNFGKRENQPDRSSQSSSLIPISDKKRSKPLQQSAIFILVALVVLGLIGHAFGPPEEIAPQTEMIPSDATNKTSVANLTASVGKMYVTSDRLIEFSCRSAKCGSPGHLFFREAIQVEEIQEGWARISPYYAVSCLNGQILVDIDEGNTACSTSNGIVNGKMARWVQSEFLSSERPVDPAASASGIAKLIGGSDDYRTYEKAFVAAAERLLASGDCTEAQIAESGGFIKSMKKGPHYFIYCGDLGLPNPPKFYLNADTGSVSRDR